ncbi:MAG: NUDIX hydrolase [Planctomycetes bacterium]|nr:NUDIX hydrolase [Planctomycetota bacterium]
MRRAPVLELLERYRAAFPRETAVADRIEALVRAHEDCLLRSCVPGHVTASAWIVAPDHERFLLTHHRKLNRWLQLGGHVDGESHMHRAAMREAREESGMTDFRFVGVDGSFDDVAPLPLDLDVHLIPARKDEPEHEHHDVRFLLVAAPNQELAISDESNDLRWFHAADFARLGSDASVARLLNKAEERLRRSTRA